MTKQKTTNPDYEKEEINYSKLDSNYHNFSGQCFNPKEEIKERV